MDRPWQAEYDAQVPKTLAYSEGTIYDLFIRAVDANPGGVATVFMGKKIRYRTLNFLINRFAAALASIGVEKGSRIALILPNLPIYPIAHLASMKLGAVLVPTNPLYVERELIHQLNDSGADTVVVFDRLYPRIQKVRSETSVKRIVVAGLRSFLPPVLGFIYGWRNKPVARTDPSAGIYTYEDLMREAGGTVETAKVDTREAALLLYTGGTTGLSKGAVLTHHNLVVNVEQIRAWLWQIRDKQEVLLCVLPFFHSYGMTTGMHLAFSCASSMVLVPRFEVKEMIKRIRKHRPTIFCGVPSMYNAINHAGVSARDVGSIRLCVSGGSALPGEVQKKFENLTGGKLVEGYGLSEASPVTHVNPVAGKRRAGSIGLPVPDTDAMIFNPDTGKAVQPGEVGELAVRGPQVMKGYWEKDDETARVLRGGWLYTGDMAVMNKEGFFSVVDRKKDLIISAGMNIYPREVEEVLHQHPKIVEAAVIGVPSKVRDEKVKAFIVIREGEDLNRQELIRFCKDKLAGFKIPKDIEFVDALPKSAVGKVLKRVLREQAISK